MRPETPVSISSNTMEPTPSASIEMAFSASMMRESSPPDAMEAMGRSGSPGLGEMRNSTSSMPAAVGFASGVMRI